MHEELWAGVELKIGQSMIAPVDPMATFIAVAVGGRRALDICSKLFPHPAIQ
jgi:hypothetical protein